MVASERKQGFRTPQSMRECMIRDAKTYLRLQPPATLACRGSSLALVALGDFSLPGCRCRLVLLRFFVLEWLGWDMNSCEPKGKDGEKYADSTSKLGVSDC